MKCDDALNYLYYADGQPDLLTRIRVSAHLFLCPSCMAHAEALEKAAMLDFLPPPSNTADLVMKLIEKEETAESPDGIFVPSIRGWVIAGLVVLLSLSTAYFGINFLNTQDRNALSFMIPMGITVGAVITAYGALFIGGNLSEITKHFGLR